MRQANLPILRWWPKFSFLPNKNLSAETTFQIDKFIRKKTMNSMESPPTTTARKTMFSFSKCTENIVFPKKSQWNMTFLVFSSRKYDFIL